MGMDGVILVRIDDFNSIDDLKYDLPDEVTIEQIFDGPIGATHQIVLLPRYSLPTIGQRPDVWPQYASIFLRLFRYGLPVWYGPDTTPVNELKRFYPYMFYKEINCYLGIEKGMLGGS